ncbi:50S ribosomal protein L29 [Candidatus Wolfebacteria bacterium CG03_land_8_20_14_0_80_40_12]|uniref:Large ribosomal subunit protein uL29 n=1 Tax=Candidatus Wolfebacteria bacterium CG03_land_8_20_14_0_80_40_12 TaxID=1975069 RepID=A0A2M7B6A3_9BACT|nr:MAG: 50S ribosomal protein L29 [Candidatus Wolfebacteria bacterium CG03_land_8_20_14_0_80_40_12]
MEQNEQQKNLVDYHEKLRVLKFDLARGKVKNVKEIKKTKKAIARILTIINKK